MAEITEEQKKQYDQYVKQITPTHSFRLQLVRAFLTGGVICVLGQVILNVLGSTGMEKQEAGIWCSVILVFLSALLTGLGIYARLAKWGGAGALVPITGFANSVAACAIEFTVEGQVFGIGCKIFNIAGPVILYGVFATWLLGLGYWLIRIWG